MKFIYAKRKLFFIAAICGCLIACVSVQGLYQDPSFTYASIKQNNIGVAGVVSVPRKLKAREQNACANVLHTALVEKYPGLVIMPAGDAVRAMGDSSYRQMMRYYRDNGVVPSDYLNILRRHVSHMRYLVFARILEDRVEHSRQTTDQQDGTNKIEYQTTLSLTIHLDVYDVQTKNIVWSGSVTDSTYNANSYTAASTDTYKHESIGHEIVQDVASMLTTQTVEQHHEYPSAPSVKQFLQTIFSELLTRFPKQQ